MMNLTLKNLEEILLNSTELDDEQYVSLAKRYIAKATDKNLEFLELLAVSSDDDFVKHIAYKKYVELQPNRKKKQRVIESFLRYCIIEYAMPLRFNAYCILRIDNVKYDVIMPRYIQQKLKRLGNDYYKACVPVCVSVSKPDVNSRPKAFFSRRIKDLDELTEKFDVVEERRSMHYGIKQLYLNKRQYKKVLHKKTAYRINGRLYAI